MNKNWTVRMLVEGATCIALAFILGRIKLFEMPQGGSITAGQMIPLIIFAIRYGAAKGIIVGALYGLVDMMIGGYVIHPAQAILDYPLAFGCLGIVGFFADEFRRTKSMKPVFIGTFIAILARLICHVLTGVIFFGSYAPVGQSAWIYSIVYNGSFLAVEFVITIIILYLLRNFITRDLSKL